MSLEQTQKDFMEYLYTPKPGQEQQDHIRGLFLGPHSPDPHGGMTIYRRNLVFGLISAMKETYVFSRVLLGEKNFNFFCREYIYQYPSHDTDLIQYGQSFGEFLNGRVELESLAFIADVARLEWALERVFYAAPEIPTRTDPDLPALKKSVQLVRTRYRVHEAWFQFHENGEEGIQKELFKPGTENLVVWPKEGQPQVTTVNDEIAVWLEKVRLDPFELGNGNVFQSALKQGWIQSNS